MTTSSTCMQCGGDRYCACHAPTSARRDPCTIYRVETRLVPCVREGWTDDFCCWIDERGLSQPADVATYLEKTLALSTRASECVVAVLLNSKNRPIAHEIVSIGTVSTSLVHPREVFRAAVREGASAVIVAHNHPSGDTSPSIDDIGITRRLRAAGRMLGISVLDHLVVAAGGQYVSLRQTTAWEDDTPIGSDVLRSRMPLQVP